MSLAQIPVFGVGLNVQMLLKLTHEHFYYREFFSGSYPWTLVRLYIEKMREEGGKKKKEKKKRG